MYSKTPPLPPPIPNEPPPPSFHPPLPTQPPPSLFQNAVYPPQPSHLMPPATLGSFEYQQQPQLSPYQSVQSHMRINHNQPAPLFNQPPRPLFDHTGPIHPLMRQSQPPVPQSQPPVQQSQPPVQQSQPPVQQPQPLIQQLRPLMQQSQPPVQQAQPYNLELRKQTLYQESSSGSYVLTVQCI